MTDGADHGDAPEKERLPARGDAPASPELKAALEPLRELAAAFAAERESLRDLAEGQLRIAKRLERSDRSEAIVTSTQALNETFRGVQRTQERLIERIEKEKKRPFIFLLTGIAAVALVAGGLLWFLLRWVGEREERAGVAGAEVLSRELIRRDETMEELRERLFARSEELLRQTGLAADGRAQLTELREGISTLTARNAELEKSRGEISATLRENARLTAESAAASRKAADLATELSREQERNRDLSKKVDELVQKLAERPARPAEPAGPAPLPVAPAPAPAVAEQRDPAATAARVEALNALLAASRGGRTYRFASLGGIRGDVLLDVVVVDLEPDGREAKRIIGAEAHLVLDPRVRRVEIRLSDGHIVYYGVEAPFWGGKYVVPVVNVDVEAWRGSGLAAVE
jgi:hypothetical protein